MRLAVVKQGRRQRIFSKKDNRKKISKISKKIPKKNTEKKDRKITKKAEK